MDAREALERRIDELCAENERLRQENQAISMAAYEVGYKNGSVHYELEHCPACKNVADLQEALDENDRLRELVRELYEDQCIEGDQWKYHDRMRELGIVIQEV